MKRSIHYEVVQAISYLDDGRLSEWWPGDKLATQKGAMAHAVTLRKKHPAQTFEVIRVTIDQMSTTAK